MNRILVALGISAALVVAGCGDDDDSGGGDLEAYCALVNELDSQESFPSEAQLEEVRDVAPDEISDEIDTVVDAFLANQDNPEAVFEDEDVTAAFDVIEPFEEENCPGQEDDVDGAGAGGSDDGSESTDTTSG